MLRPPILRDIEVRKAVGRRIPNTDARGPKPPAASYWLLFWHWWVHDCSYKRVAQRTRSRELEKIALAMLVDLG